jgi:hypothetical protein
VLRWRPFSRRWQPFSRQGNPYSDSETKYYTRDQVISIIGLQVLFSSAPLRAMRNMSYKVGDLSLKGRVGVLADSESD